MEISDKPIGNVYIPCFKLQNLNQKVDYLNGFCISQDRYVQDAFISSEVALSPLEPHEGALSFDPTDNCVVFDDDFCIVMTH